MRQVLKLVAGIAVALVAFAGFSGAAGAQDDLEGYEPGGCAVLEGDYLSPVQAGGDFVVSNGLTDPNAEITVAIGEYPLGGTLVADDEGVFEGTLTVPADIPPGSYELFVTCNGVEYQNDEGVEVLAAAGDNGGNGGTTGGSTTPISTDTGTNTGSTPLARTGFDARPVATLGAAALVLGGAALYGSRRRRAVA